MKDHERALLEKLKKRDLQNDIYELVGRKWKHTWFWISKNDGWPCCSAMEAGVAKKQYIHHHEKQQYYKQQRYNAGRNSHQAWQQKNVHLIQQRAIEFDACDYNSIGDPYLLGRLDNIIGHFRNDFQGEDSCKREGPLFGIYGSFLPVTFRPSPTDVNNPVSTQNCRVHEPVTVGAVEKASRLETAALPGKNSSLSGINSSTQEIRTHTFKSSKDTLDKRQMTSTEVEDHLDFSPKSTIQCMLSFNTCPLSPMPKRHANLFTEKCEFSMGGSPNRIDFEQGTDIEVLMPKKKLTSLISESKKKPDLELQGGTAKKLKKDADTKRRTSKESGIMTSRTSRNLPNELCQEKSKMQGTCGMNTHIHKESDLITDELKGSAYTQDFGACSLKGHKQAGATQHLDMSLKPENGNMTGNKKKIAINQGQGQVKELRKDLNQKGFVSDVKKMNKPVKKVMKSGLLDDDRIEAHKKEHRGQTVSKEMVVTDTDHGMEKGADNVKTHNTSQKALKEKTNEVTRDKFKKSGKETQLKSFFLGSTVNNEPAKTNMNSKEFHVSGVKRKFEQVDIKKETNILNSSFNIKKARQLEKEEKRDVTENAGTTTSNAYVSNVVGTQSLVELRTQEPPIAEPVPSVTVDSWVECVKCNKWRLLPFGVNHPSVIEKWFCSMQNWLPPEMSNCEISEEETKLAFYKLCGVSQSHIQTDKTWANVELPAPVVSKRLSVVKSANQVLQEDILLSPSKIRPINKGIVQRSLPLVKSANQVLHEDILLSPSKIHPIKKGIMQRSLAAVKSANQVLQEDILQSPSKIHPIKRGIVQRSRPCGSIKDKLSCSLIENGEKYPVNIAKDSRAFSQCENEGKVNGGIKKKITGKTKAKLKQISRGQGVAKTLKVKCKGDEEFKGYNTANKFGVEENLVQSTKVVDLLPLKPVRTDGLKDSTYTELAKGNEQYFVPLSASLRKMPKDTCTQSTKYQLNDSSLADDNKFRDQHQAIKKRKLKEHKQSNSIQHGLLETERLEGFEPRREERQVGMLRKKPLKLKKIEARKEDKVRIRKKVRRAATNSELVIDEMENQCRQKSGEHDMMQNTSGQTEVLKGDSTYLVPFVTTTSSSSKLPCYTKMLGSIPNVGGSSIESTVSSLTARNLKAKISSARRKSALKDDCTPCEGQVVYSENFDASSGESSRVPGEAGTHGKGNLCVQLQAPILNGFVRNDFDLAAVDWVKEHWFHPAKVTFQQGRDLAEKADQIKNKEGAESDFVGLYFHASLKFLHCASILEHLSSDSARKRVKESLALYQYSARLSEECAKTYEGNEKWAAATIAYYCGGSAYMCIVKAKTATINLQELESAVQHISSGESPCSSVSNVDNLNNHALTHGNCSVNPDKGLGSLPASRNYVIDQQHFAHYNHLLRYVGNTAIGMENFSKAQVAFLAFKRTCCEEIKIDAVRRAIDFSCYNIDGLLHLVHLAMDAIDH